MEHGTDLSKHWPELAKHIRFTIRRHPRKIAENELSLAYGTVLRVMDGGTAASTPDMELSRFLSNACAPPLADWLTADRIVPEDLLIVVCVDGYLVCRALSINTARTGDPSAPVKGNGSAISS